MSYPTTLSPWFVVYQRDHETEDTAYYMSGSEAETPNYWSSDAPRAMIFMSLASAARVADAEGAHVRVLWSKSEADEFGRF